MSPSAAAKARRTESIDFLSIELLSLSNGLKIFATDGGYAFDRVFGSVLLSMTPVAGKIPGYEDALYIAQLPRADRRLSPVRNALMFDRLMEASIEHATLHECPLVARVRSAEETMALHRLGLQLITHDGHSFMSTVRRTPGTVEYSKRRGFKYIRDGRNLGACKVVSHSSSRNGFTVTMNVETEHLHETGPILLAAASNLAERHSARHLRLVAPSDERFNAWVLGQGFTIESVGHHAGSDLTIRYTLPLRPAPELGEATTAALLAELTRRNLP